MHFIDPETFATVKYSDTDNNGFIDVIEYDLDGDNQFETIVSLKELGINDVREVINISKFEYSDFNNLYKKIASDLWSKAESFMKLAEDKRVNTKWYAQLMNPKSDREKYHNGYWLSFYLYKDLKQLASIKADQELDREIDLLYYSWSK